MQHCPHCGTQMEDGARFCGACGKRIDAPPTTASAPAAAPAPASGPAPAASAAKSAGPVSKRAVEPLAATMLSSGPLPGGPLAAFAPSLSPPAAAPPSNSVPTVAAPPSANPVAGLAPPGAGASPVRPAARPAENFIGRTLNNRYVVEDKIGEGGFGAVFSGKQIGTGREVALKILHP